MISLAVVRMGQKPKYKKILSKILGRPVKVKVETKVVSSFLAGVLESPEVSQEFKDLLTKEI